MWIEDKIKFPSKPWIKYDLTFPQWLKEKTINDEGIIRAVDNINALEKRLEKTLNAKKKGQDYDEDYDEDYFVNAIAIQNKILRKARQKIATVKNK